MYFNVVPGPGRAAISECIVSRKVIETEMDISAGVRALRRKCRHMRLIHDQVGDPPLRRHASGFPGLARIVVGQQLSIASATAIWSRLEAAIVPLNPARLSDFDDGNLRGLGLSRSKVATLRALAEALERGDLDIATLDQADDARVHEILTGLRGFGPWSADIYIMFCLGRRDGFAAGDLALQEGARMALGLERRPTPAELSAISERWRPWRGVAARLLWSHYAFNRKLSSALPA